MGQHENAYVGVFPEPGWQAEPINTPEEVAKLQEVGLLPPDEVEKPVDENGDGLDKPDGQPPLGGEGETGEGETGEGETSEGETSEGDVAPDNTLPAEDSANDGSREVVIDTDEEGRVVVVNDNAESKDDGDKDNDGLLDSPSFK